MNSNEQNNMNRKKYMEKFMYMLLGIVILMFLSILIGLIWTLFVSPINTEANEQVIISVIAIAVTVWIGLNIYNIVSKDDIDRLQKDLITTIEISNDELQNGLKEIKDNIQITDIKLSIIQFISLLNETKTMYIISYYFSINLSNSNIKIHNVDYLVEIEYSFIKTTQFYENGNYEKSCVLAQKVINMIEIYENMTKKMVNNPFISAYNKCRLSDMYYYKNISAQRCHQEANIEELERSIQLYYELKNFIEKQYINDGESKPKYIKNEVYAYIYNSIAYTYQELGSLTTSEAEKNKYYHNAKKNYKMIFLYYKERGRYYRNYGTFLERNGEKAEAMKNYKIAIELDKSDYKAYNNLYSLNLKIIENKIKNDLNGKLLFEFSNRNIITSKDQKMIKECIVRLKNTIQMNTAFCDCYYNLAKAYMLKYLCIKRDESLLNEAMIVNDFVFVLDKQNAGALFTKRNIYEAWRKIDEANMVNDEIKNTIHRKNDTDDKKKKYEEYLGGVKHE